MSRKIKKYSVTTDSDVFAISLVSEPAIESDFVFLSEHKEQTYIQLENNEKHLVIGAVLIPDKPIYRNQNGNEFFIEFSKETIEKLAYDYLMSGRMWSTTLQHQEIAENVCVVESWLKTSDNDKSVDLGLDVPIGTWLCSMKVLDDTTWQRVKSSELAGFSVEAFINLDEILLNKIQNQNMTENLETVEINESFWQKIKAIIADALGNGAETEPEDVVEEIKDVVEEEQPVIELAEDDATAIIEEDVVDDKDAEIQRLTEENEALKIEIEDLKNQLAARDNENVELSKQVEKLSKQPSTEPIKIEASKTNDKPSFLDFASGKIKF